MKRKRKRRKKTKLQLLQERAHGLWKAVCFLRDGKRCQVQIHHPDLPIKHTLIYQVDHCFSRGIKDLFVDPSNGTVVCSSCNRAKYYRSHAIDVLINEIVIKREGRGAYDKMLRKAKATPSGNWHNVVWLENQIMALSAQLQSIEVYSEYE